MARAGCGGVEYWMKLPVTEVVNYMVEVAQQIADENAEAERERR